MPIRIETEVQMQLARRRVNGDVTGSAQSDGFCYICGNRLPRRGPNGACGAQISTEHVIPKAVLGHSENAAVWNLTLPVHRACEEANKRLNDTSIRAVHALHTKPQATWRAEELAAVRPFVSQMPDDSGHAKAVLRGVQPMIDGIQTWIRGLHAALYGSYVQSLIYYRVLSPLPGCWSGSTATLSEQISEEQDASQTILKTLVGSFATGEWDGVVLRGGEVRYQCSWYPMRHRRHGVTVRAMCSWLLTFPDALAMSATVQTPVPWRGYYGSVNGVPAGASRITSDTIEAANRELLRLRERGPTLTS